MDDIIEEETTGEVMEEESFIGEEEEADTEIEYPIFEEGDGSTVAETHDSLEEAAISEARSEMRQFMVHCIEESNIHFLDKLLDEPFSDINMTHFGETLLMMAIRLGHQTMSRFLIENGINYNAKKVLFADNRKKWNTERTEGRRGGKTPAPFETKAPFDWYTVSCRQFAYEREMTDIVEIIDHLNGDLYYFQHHPEITVKDRSYKRGMFSSVVSLNECFFEGCSEDCNHPQSSSISNEEEEEEENASSGPASELLLSQPASSRASSSHTAKDTLPQWQEPLPTTYGSRIVTGRLDGQFLSPRPTSSLSRAHSSASFGPFITFSGSRCSSPPSHNYQPDSSFPGQGLLPFRETRSSLLRQRQHNQGGKASPLLTSSQFPIRAPRNASLLCPLLPMDQMRSSATASGMNPRSKSAALPLRPRSPALSSGHFYCR